MGIFLINKLWDFDGFTMGILYSDARIQPIGTIQHLGPQLSFCLTPRNLLVSPMWFGKSKLILVSIHIYPCIFFVESHIILWFFLCHHLFLLQPHLGPESSHLCSLRYVCPSVIVGFRLYLDGQIDIVCTYCV